MHRPSILQPFLFFLYIVVVVVVFRFAFKWKHVLTIKNSFSFLMCAYKLEIYTIQLIYSVVYRAYRLESTATTSQHYNAIGLLFYYRATSVDILVWSGNIPFFPRNSNELCMYFISMPLSYIHRMILRENLCTLKK